MVAHARPTPTAYVAMKELAEIALKLQHDTLTSGLEWFARYAELRTELKDWSACRRPFRSFNRLVDDAVPRCPHPGGALGTGASFAASCRLQGCQGKRQASEVQDVCLWAAFGDEELARKLGPMVCTPVSAARWGQGGSRDSTGGSAQEGGKAPKDGRRYQKLLRRLRKLKCMLQREMDTGLNAGTVGRVSGRPVRSWRGRDGERAIGAPLRCIWRLPTVCPKDPI